MSSCVSDGLYAVIKQHMNNFLLSIYLHKVKVFGFFLKSEQSHRLEARFTTTVTNLLRRISWLRARGLVVSDLRSETKGSWLEFRCQPRADVSPRSNRPANAQAPVKRVEVVDRS